VASLNISLLVVGGLVLLLGLLSGLARRIPLSEPLVALVVGALLGPTVLGWLDVASWGNQEVILEQAARLTLAIGLMGVALRLPKGYVRRQWRPLAVLLGLVMPLMWLASGLLAYALLGVPFWVAMLIGAVVTPTDPVVSTTIVTGAVAERNLPDRLKRIISAESGANDGLAYPLVFLPLLLLERPPGEALLHWLTRTMLWEVGGAVLLAVLVGYGAGRLLQWAEAEHTIEETSLIAYSLSLSLAVLGGAKLLGTNGILAVFVAGIAFDAATGSEQEEEHQIQEAVNRFFILPIFVLLGLMLPWREWLELGWRGVLLVGAVMLLRRLPAVLALNPLLRVTRGRGDALFLGWFGPIGVAALYYATLAQGRTGLDVVWVVGSLVVCTSVLVHGVSAAPLTELYGRRARGGSSG